MTIIYRVLNSQFKTEIENHKNHIISFKNKLSKLNDN